MMTVITWWLVNLDTGETRRVRAADEADACRAAGWPAEACDVRLLPPRRLA